MKQKTLYKIFLPLLALLLCFAAVFGVVAHKNAVASADNSISPYDFTKSDTLNNSVYSIQDYPQLLIGRNAHIEYVESEVAKLYKSFLLYADCVR
ncbi:MAG: hypothetical protein K2L42_04625 [Clostridia bacterium]|nr:hypothetical protein [Clostridia bacterium]